MKNGRKKDSAITYTDIFCGCGGSSSGAMDGAAQHKLKGGSDVKLVLALNHWTRAIETHKTNFPDTYHEATDVQAVDPRRYVGTDILMISPECTNHSLAKGQKKVTEQMDLYEQMILDPAAERSRATMWDVVRFAEVHKYRHITVENVVDAHKWVLWDSWLKAMLAIGYEHEIISLNSMFCHPTPQSRDRIYVVFWKKGYKKPDLRITPRGYCVKCGHDVDSIQRWKAGRRVGKYKQQYDYCCPTCATQVNPYYYAAFNAIDWSDLGSRIGDRKKPLCDNTMRRIRYGLDKYADPFVINNQQSTGVDFRVRHVTDKIPTGSHPENVCMPFISMNEHTKTEPQVRAVTDAMQTQTTRQSMAVIFPFIVDMHRTGKAKSAAEFIGTQTAGGINHALVVHNKGQSNSKEMGKPLGCVTTKDYLGIVTSEAMNSFLTYYYGESQASHISEVAGTVTTKERMALIGIKPKIDDCFYRMLKPKEVQRAMAFSDSFIMTGSGKEQVKQSGNAVTPPAMALIQERILATYL